MIQASEFENFVDFARDRLDQAQSLSQLLRTWEAQREEAANLASIQQGIDEMEAGLGIPLEEAMAELRGKLGLKQ